MFRKFFEDGPLFYKHIHIILSEFSKSDMMIRNKSRKIHNNTDIKSTVEWSIT